MSRRAEVMAMIPALIPKPKRGKRVADDASVSRVVNALDWDAVDDAGNDPKRLRSIVEAAAKRALG
jgi:hypothetical protein